MKPVTYYASSRSDIAARLPEEVTRLLDVGCGEGGFGALVRERCPDAEIWGVEPSALPAARARTRLTRVCESLFDDSADIPETYFDVITFNDSLEHMIDEVRALRLAASKLVNNGIMICSVPNVRYFENMRSLLIQKDWRYEDQGILDRTHLRFFTKRSLVRTIQECGFSVESVTGINSHWWSGWKIGLLKFLFRDAIEDMRWLQFIVVARKVC